MSSRKLEEFGLVKALLEEDLRYIESKQRSHPTALSESPPNILPSTYIDLSRKRSGRTMSLHSDDTQDTAPTNTSIAPLQDIASVQDKQNYHPVQIDDPRSFDLVEPGVAQERTYSLEARVDLLLSKEHLKAIFADAKLFLKFTTFLSKHRPNSIPLLIYYLDTTKALKAIEYSNAILDGLGAVSFADFTNVAPKHTTNASLEEKADRAFTILTQEDLPAYITHVFVDIISTSIRSKITGTMAPQLREASEGLAEVFCMSDMSKPDNPIVFSSEEFHRTTQYGLNYAVGRNCRFLQGPHTDSFSVHRIREVIRTGRDHQDILLNYRRDGSPFLNLLTLAPLLDDHGKVRYFIGAQIDVSGLVRDSTNLEALARLVDEQETENKKSTKDKKDEFQSLSEMFNHSELESVRLHGGRMHSEQHDADHTPFPTHASHRPRLLIREPSDEEEEDFSPPANHSTLGPTSPPTASPHSSLSLNAGRLPGVFAHYLILRPHPSLRITYTSPSLRVPGLLQSPFLSRIGGSRRVREELALALSEGRNVTAKIRWLLERNSELSDDYGSHQPAKSRWIHCTPLLGATRAIGAWMVIIIDSDDNEQQTKTSQTQRSGTRQAAPVGNNTTTQNPAPPSINNSSEWNLDLEIETTGPFPHPPSGNSASHTVGLAGTTTSTTIPPPLPRHAPPAFNTSTSTPRSPSLIAFPPVSAPPKRPLTNQSLPTTVVVQPPPTTTPPGKGYTSGSSNGKPTHKLAAHRMLGTFLKSSAERGKA